MVPFKIYDVLWFQTPFFVKKEGHPMQTPYATFSREVGLCVYLESRVYSVRLIDSMRNSEILCCKSPFFEKVGGQSNILSEKTASTITLHIGKTVKIEVFGTRWGRVSPPPLIQWGTVSPSPKKNFGVG